MSGLTLNWNVDPSYGVENLTLPFSGTSGAESLFSRYPIIQRGNTPSADLSQFTQRQKILSNPTLEAKSYEALVRAKVWTGMVATHLPAEDRKRLFRSLDRLHDTDEWEAGDVPVQEASFVNFLQTILKIKPTKTASLGMSYDGNIFAIWGTPTDRVTLEFLNNSTIKWVLSYKDENDSIIRSAGVAPAQKISSLLAPYNPEHWFHDR